MPSVDWFITYTHFTLWSIFQHEQMCINYGKSVGSAYFSFLNFKLGHLGTFHDGYYLIKLNAFLLWSSLGTHFLNPLSIHLLTFSLEVMVALRTVGMRQEVWSKVWQAVEEPPCFSALGVAALAVGSSLSHHQVVAQSASPAISSPPCINIFPQFQTHAMC
jgi:hypothetical protein